MGTTEQQTDAMMVLVNCKECRNGYVALLSVLIVSAIAATTVLILFITSINSTLNSRDAEEGKSAKIMAEACAELAMQLITNQGDVGCTFPECIEVLGMPNGYCKVVEIADVGPGTGTDWRVRTSGSGIYNRVTKHIEIYAIRPLLDEDPPYSDSTTGSAAYLQSWKEVDGSQF